MDTSGDGDGPALSAAEASAADSRVAHQLVHSLLLPSAPQPFAGSAAAASAAAADDDGFASRHAPLWLRLCQLCPELLDRVLASLLSEAKGQCSDSCP